MELPHALADQRSENMRSVSTERVGMAGPSARGCPSQSLLSIRGLSSAMS